VNYRYFLVGPDCVCILGLCLMGNSRKLCLWAIALGVILIGVSMKFKYGFGIVN
jgi:hypothetical protein